MPNALAQPDIVSTIGSGKKQAYLPPVMTVDFVLMTKTGTGETREILGCKARHLADRLTQLGLVKNAFWERRT